MNTHDRADIKELKADVKQILQDVAALKVKSGIWGAMGGMCTVLVALVVGFFSKAIK